MRIIITGATGFVGKNLTSDLLSSGHEVIALSRNLPKAKAVLGKDVTCVEWDAETPEGWQEYVEGADAIVNLAGENLADNPWTKAVKQKIINSRINAGRAVTLAIQKAKKKPALLLQSSAVGYYGSRGDEELDETSQPGEGFIVEVVRQWEHSVSEVKNEGVRVVYMRSGVVLGRGEGMLGKLALPFKLFVGGHPGSGKQWISWSHIQDMIQLMRFLMAKEQLSGVFNLVSPQPVRMKEFCRHLGRALNRPSWFPVPALLLKFVLQDMAEETVLASQKVLPKRIADNGYKFKFPEVSNAMEDIFT